MRRWIRGRAPATTATCATSAGSWRRAMADQLEREDLEARVRALDERRSILLQAPAGSGKTSVLTQRFLRLLATVDDPGAILAVTFTRKAAAEMRARVIRALRGEVRADEPCAPELGGLAEAARQHARSRGRSLEEDTQALRIQTIDSFTYWLASQLPIAARAGRGRAGVGGALRGGGGGEGPAAQARGGVGGGAREAARPRGRSRGSSPEAVRVLARVPTTDWLACRLRSAARAAGARGDRQL